jgi:hypothetical protein
MRIRSSILAMAAVALAITAACHADVVELRSGGTIRGTYVGGSANTVNIETAQGLMMVSTADVQELRFSAPPPPPVVVIPPPPPVGGPASVPAGTVLLVRMDTQVSSKDSSGKKFSGRLVSDLMAGYAVVARAGTPVIGEVEQAKQAGRLAGKSQLQITLRAIDFSGRLVPILTTNFAETGQSSFKKTARNVAVGAAIGNSIDRTGGAGKGAAVGVGVSLIRQGDSVTVPAGAILEFRLIQPLNVLVGG